MFTRFLLISFSFEKEDFFGGNFYTLQSTALLSCVSLLFTSGSGKKISVCKLTVAFKYNDNHLALMREKPCAALRYLGIALHEDLGSSSRAESMTGQLHLGPARPAAQG